MTVTQRISAGIFLVMVAAVLGATSLHASGAVPAMLRTGGLATAAFLCGLAVALLWRGDVLPAALSGYGIGVILVAAIGLASTPVNGLVPTFLALTFGMAALVSLAMALHRIWTTGETVRLESDWGGLGHGFGGWQLSTPATLLLCALAFGSMTVGATVLYANQIAAADKEHRDTKTNVRTPEPTPVPPPTVPVPRTD